MEAGGALTSAETIPALGEKIGVPVDALAETVARASGGEFDPPRSGTMAAPLATPPFHAAPLCAGITGTMGGIEIDADAHALRRDGSPFPGLYAVGTPVAHLEGGPRAGYVGGLCKAFVLGLLAAEHSQKQRGKR